MQLPSTTSRIYTLLTELQQAREELNERRIAWTLRYSEVISNLDECAKRYDVLTAFQPDNDTPLGKANLSRLRVALSALKITDKHEYEKEVRSCLEEKYALWDEIRAMSEDRHMLEMAYEKNTEDLLHLREMKATLQAQKAKIARATEMEDDTQDEGAEAAAAAAV